MNYQEAQEFVEKEFLPVIKEKFLEQWPTMFDSCHKVVSEDHNYNMYYWYMKIIIALHRMPESSRYHRNYDDLDNMYLFIKEMYYDFQRAENFLLWLIENINPK